MEALRAHAHSASSGIRLVSPTDTIMYIFMHSLMNINRISYRQPSSSEPVHVDIEPDPEPEIPSPTHNIPRGPSPEAKPDDTECHRSQSAMYVLQLKRLPNPYL